MMSWLCFLFFILSNKIKNTNNTNWFNTTTQTTIRSQYINNCSRNTNNKYVYEKLKNHNNYYYYTTMLENNNKKIKSHFASFWVFRDQQQQQIKVFFEFVFFFQASNSKIANIYIKKRQLKFIFFFINKKP